MPKVESKSKSNKPDKKAADKTTYKEYPRSYRFDHEIMDTLKNTLNRINQISPKKVSETRLVKSLIWLSKEMDKDEILKALKEVW